MHNSLQFTGFRASLSPLTALGARSSALNKEHCYIYDGQLLVCYYKIRYFKKLGLWYWQLFTEQFDEESVTGDGLNPLSKAKEVGRAAIKEHVTKAVNAYNAANRLEL